MMKRIAFEFAAALMLLTGTALSAQAAEKPRQDELSLPSAEAKAGARDQNLLKGVENYRQGGYEEAYEYLVKAREGDPQSSVAAYYLGATLKKLQLFSKAIPHLREAVSLKPPVNQAYLELADAYYAVGNLDGAVHALDACRQEGIEPAQTAFLTGLVQMKKRRYADARVSFEAARSRDNSLASASDFQLALIYDRLGKTEKARELFLQVSGREGESDVGMMARQQADALANRQDSKKTFQAAADVQYQYDSNVVLKPDSSITASISNEKDYSTAMSVQAEYEPAFGAPFDLKFRYDLYLNLYQKLTTYDTQKHTAGISSRYRFGENAAGIDVDGSYMLVDNGAYYQSAALTTYYSFVTGESQFMKTFLMYRMNDYLITPATPDEDRDGNEASAGIHWFSLMAGRKGYVSAKYELNRDDTTGRNWTYLGNKLSAGVLYPFTDRLRAGLDFEAFLQDFDNERTYDAMGDQQLKRRDTSYLAVLQGFYGITRHIDLHLQCMYVKNESTIGIYEYHKELVGLGLYAKF